MAARLGRIAGGQVWEVLRLMEEQWMMGEALNHPDVIG
jgi:hypothetical protein